MIGSATINDTPETRLESSVPRETLRKFVPSASWGFVDQLGELAELMKVTLNSEGTKCKLSSELTASSITMLKPKVISEFSFKPKTADKFIQTDYLVKVSSRENKIRKPKLKRFFAPKINQHKPTGNSDKLAQHSKPAVVNLKIIEAIDKPEYTERTFNLDLDHFDSGNEDSYLHEEIDTDSRPYLYFMNKSLFNREDGAIRESSENILHLHPFIKSSVEVEKDNRVYTCKFCGNVFTKRAALGGHMSKNHPNQSEDYKKRIESALIRKIERDRVDYLRTIKGELN